MWPIKLAPHELLGYTAGEIITVLANEVHDIAMNHGLVMSKNRCFHEKGLIRMIERHNFEEGIEFKSLPTNPKYYQKAYPNDLCLKGEALSLDDGNFPDVYKKRFFDYFRNQYNLPKDREELLERMNRSH